MHVPLRANGSIKLTLPGASLRVVSDWSDEASVRVLRMPPGGTLAVGAGEGANSAMVSLADAPGTVVECRVPQSTNVVAAACRGVDVAGRLEGDVLLEATDESASVAVDKLRGSDIVLNAGGDVDVRGVVEGERVALMAGSRVTVKKAMSDSVRIECGGAREVGDHGSAVSTGVAVPPVLSVGSLYAAETTLHSAGSGGVDVGSAHGFMRVVAGGAVAVSGLSGGADVVTVGAGSLHVDKLDLGARAHIALRSAAGDVAVTLAPEVEVQLRAAAGGAVTAGKWLTEARREQDDALLCVEGSWRSSAEKSRKSSAHTGKINLGGADASSLSTSFYGGSAEDGDAVDGPALLSLEAPCGDVSVDRQDWQSMVLAKIALRKKLEAGDVTV